MKDTLKNLPKLISEDGVKAELELFDWKKITLNKVLKFAGLTPRMTEEVQKECLKQMPSLAAKIVDIIKQDKELSVEIIKDDHEQSKQINESYSKIVEHLIRRNESDISNEEREENNRKMFLTMKYMENNQERNRQFTSSIFKALGGLSMFALSMVLSVLSMRNDRRF